MWGLGCRDFIKLIFPLNRRLYPASSKNFYPLRGLCIWHVYFDDERRKVGRRGRKASHTRLCKWMVYSRATTSAMAERLAVGFLGAVVLDLVCWVGIVTLVHCVRLNILYRVGLR